MVDDFDLSKTKKAKKSKTRWIKNQKSVQPRWIKNQKYLLYSNLMAMFCELNI